MTTRRRARHLVRDRGEERFTNLELTEERRDDGTLIRSAVEKPIDGYPMARSVTDRASWDQLAPKREDAWRDPGGAPSGTGLTRDRILDAIEALWRDHPEYPPTFEAVRHRLLDPDRRWMQRTLGAYRAALDEVGRRF